MQRRTIETLVAPRNVAWRVVIADCDHEDLEQEVAVAERAGIRLDRAWCRTEDEVIAASEQADGIVAQYAPISRRVIDALPGLRAIARYGVGVDTVDVAAASEAGIPVCNVPDYGTEDVSDHAVSLIADVSRSVALFDRALRSGDYSLAAGGRLRRFNTQTVGVVGLGLIGRATARKARGLGFTVIGSDPARTVGEVVDGIPVVAFDELLRDSDVVSLHVPLIDATRHLIDERALAAMKPSAAIVNTCRGAVIDTDSLAAALEQGSLRAAALDVFESEPLQPGDAIARAPRTVLTPHVAWYSEESISELKRRTLENVISALAGRLVNAVNGDALAGAQGSAA